MIEAIGTPFGRSPVRRSFLMSASLQVPMPVSLSCVMLDAMTLNGGSSQDSPPEKSLPAIAAGGPFGEWQLPQVMIVLTRYDPRSSLVSANAAPALAKVSVASIAATTVTLNCAIVVS